MATFLAPGELMNFCRLGFFIYWQRHGLCSFILAQQTAEGLPAVVIATAQGVSCSGLQVTAAFATLTSPIARTTTIATNMATHPTLLFIFWCVCVCVLCVCLKCGGRIGRDVLGNDLVCISIYRECKREMEVEYSSLLM